MRVILEPEEIAKIYDIFEALKKRGKDITDLDRIELDEYAVFPFLRDEKEQ